MGNATPPTENATTPSLLATIPNPNAATPPAQARSMGGTAAPMISMPTVGKSRARDDVPKTTPAVLESATSATTLNWAAVTDSLQVNGLGLLRHRPAGGRTAPAVKLEPVRNVEKKKGRTTGPAFSQTGSPSIINFTPSLANPLWFREVAARIPKAN